MRQQMRESMSALLDQETDDFDLQRILNGLDQDEDAAKTWRRYNLVSAAMRNELGDFAGVDLSGRIRERLAGEEDIGSGLALAERARTWIKPFASVAVAASVTAAILTGTQWYTSVTGDVPAAAPALASNGRVGAVGAVGQVVGFGQTPAAALVEYPSGRQTADAMAQRRLDAFLQNHVEHTSLNTSNGMMPFARAIRVEGYR